MLLFAILLACPSTDDSTTADDTSTVDTVDTSDTVDTDDTGWERATITCPESTPAPDLADEWALADPAPGGDFYTLVAAPSDASRLYAASYSNGMYRTDDSAFFWTHLRTQITHIGSQLAVHPTDPDRIAYAADWVYTSDDGGDTYTQQMLGGTGVGERVRAMMWLDEGSLLSIDEDGDVWKSVDAGASWDRHSFLTWRNNHESNEVNGGYGLQGNWWYLFQTDDGTLFTARHTGNLYRSTDGGLNWQTAQGGFMDLGTFGTDGDRVWIASQDQLFYTEDAGENWEQVNYTYESFTGAVRTATGKLLFFNADEAFELTGGSLVNATPLPDANDRISVARAADGTLVAMHKDGSYKSTDHGASWQEAKAGLVDDDLSLLLAHPDCDNLLLVGTQCERGLYTSVDWGNDLVHNAHYMHYTMVMSLSPADPNEIWITTDDEVLYTTDLGVTWQDGWTTDVGYHYHGLDIHPRRPNTVLVGSVGSGTWSDESGKVYKTTDHGETWRDVSEGIPANEASMHAIHFVEADPDVVLLGTFRAADIAHNGPPGIGMYRSADGGESWSRVDLDVDDVSRIEECDQGVWAATDGGMLLSTDLGLTWEAKRVADAEFITFDCRGDSIIAFDQSYGMHRSDDGGETWRDYNEGFLDNLQGEFTNDYLHSVDISADGSVIYLALRATGLLRRPF